MGGGTTAASLGLVGSGVTGNSSTIDGRDIYYLSSNLSLDALNNGSGVSTSTALPDISYTLANGDSGTIDLWSVPTGGTSGVAETTLGQVIAEINAAAPKELSASIDPATNQIVVTDKTSGGGTFSLTGAERLQRAVRPRLRHHGLRQHGHGLRRHDHRTATSSAACRACS